MAKFSDIMIIEPFNCEPPWESSLRGPFYELYSPMALKELAWGMGDVRLGDLLELISICFIMSDHK